MSLQYKRCQKSEQNSVIPNQANIIYLWPHIWLKGYREPVLHIDDLK